MMWWWKRRVQANTEDVEEARALREEAKAKREALAQSDNGVISAIVHRRTLDGFGEELQITFTRRTANDATRRP